MAISQALWSTSLSQYMPSTMLQKTQRGIKHRYIDMRPSLALSRP
ncbi:hypothetical protein ACULNC_06825 [Shigella flexneri]